MFKKFVTAFVFLIAISILLYIAFGPAKIKNLTGSSYSEIKTGKNTKLESNISKKEYEKIKKLIILDTKLVQPNKAGFMTFYGDVLNKSSRTVKVVKVVIENTEGKNFELEKKGILGEQELYNIAPGQIKSFDIVSSMEVPDYSGHRAYIRKLIF